MNHHRASTGQASTGPAKTGPASTGPAKKRRLAVGFACILTAGCASGDSILNAGNDPTTTVTPASSPDGSSGGPDGPQVGTTISLGGPQAPTTISLGGPQSTPTTIPMMGTTIPLGGPGPSGYMRPQGPAAQEFEPCPVDALDTADEPVPLVFWHAMNAVNEEALVALTEEYNASQDQVVVELQNQTGYNELVDKYFQSNDEDRPDLVQMPEYMTQQMADSDSVVAAGMCIQTQGYDVEPFIDRGLLAYQTGGVQWSMPFNISGPVLFYNQVDFEEAGLDPEAPPVSLEELREASQAIVDSGSATYGIAFDSGVDSGGGWFLEQWYARLGLPYSDNGNGRLAPSTAVSFDTPEGVEMLTYVQEMVNDGLAMTVGDNPQSIDVLLKLADPAEPAAMGIATSASLGTVLDVVEGGLIEGITVDDIGVGPMPGPSDTPSAIIGGASLYVVAGKSDATTAAAWEFVQFLVSAESQATWASMTGYVPVREDAVELEPLATTYVDDPRFRVAYDQLLGVSDDLSSVGPVLGPLRQVREVTAQMMAEIFGGADVQTALTAAAQQSNLLIADYASSNT